MYLFLKILETVDWWIFNFSEISLLDKVSIFVGLFSKKLICFEIIISPTFKTVSFLLFIEDKSHFASDIFSESSLFFFDF